MMTGKILQQKCLTFIPSLLSSHQQQKDVLSRRTTSYTMKWHYIPVKWPPRPQRKLQRAAYSQVGGMHTPALTRCISLHLAALNCPFSKPISSAAEIPPRPPTQKAAGGRPQSRQTIPVAQKVFFCPQH